MRPGHRGSEAPAHTWSLWLCPKASVILLPICPAGGPKSSTGPSTVSSAHGLLSSVFYQKSSLDWLCGCKESRGRGWGSYISLCPPWSPWPHSRGREERWPDRPAQLRRQRPQGTSFGKGTTKPVKSPKGSGHLGTGDRGSPYHPNMCCEEGAAYFFGLKQPHLLPLTCPHLGTKGHMWRGGDRGGVCPPAVCLSTE